MKFLVIHNDYGTWSGEEATVATHCQILKDRGHAVVEFRRSSLEIPRQRFGRARAFVSGVFNPGARRDIRALVSRERPDIAFVQNLYPLISPAILPVLRQEGVPVVMQVANFRLVCPNGLLLSHGEICSRCVGGREYWCVLRDCEQHLPRSVGYALRGAVARRRRWYVDNVSFFMTATEFLRNWVARAGVDPRRIRIVSNPVVAPQEERVRRGLGRYVGYFGRVSREKGIGLLLDAARACPDVPFELAGASNPDFRLPGELPPNVRLLGPLRGDALAAFIQDARVVVNPSTCYETFGMSVAEAMLYARPVVVPAHGAFPELVKDGETGLLHAPGDAASLASAIRQIWDSPALGSRLGDTARRHALREYGVDTYYDRFMAACDAASAFSRGSARRPLP
jgi:glycosyltransferase involved in cell wall biosynthesis